jgi:hypothetical protein
MFRLAGLLVLILSACGGGGGGGEGGEDDVPLTGTYDLAVSGGTDDGFPRDVVPESIELVIEEDSEGLLDVLFDGEIPSSVSSITVGGQADITFEASIPVQPADPADCPFEWLAPFGTIELHVEDGTAAGTAEGIAYCDSATARYRFELEGDRQ